MSTMNFIKHDEIFWRKNTKFRSKIMKTDTVNLIFGSYLSLNRWGELNKHSCSFLKFIIYVDLEQKKNEFHDNIATYTV